MNPRLRLLCAGLVLGTLLGGSFWQVLARRTVVADPDRITLRLGHWLLQTSMRESFDEAAAEYHRLHPRVTIEQVAVPIRLWPSWLRTQLIGGTAPDLMGLRNANEEILNRYFIPLTDHVGAPNPYNAGTPLEGVPWRETFVDGLTGMRNLAPTTGEIPAVMLQLNTTRLFYNRALLRAVTGSGEPPADYAALIALGPQVAACNARAGRRLVPIAACGPYAEYLFSNLLPSQTQKLVAPLSPMPSLMVKPADTARLLLQGRLSYRDTPELRASLDLLRDVSTLLPPGFSQLQRDDALFTFMQGNAVMIFAGSWDYTAFARDAGFEVGICPLPLPTPADPRFGRFVAGPPAESGGTPEAAFGIVRTSRHPEVALDFLRFLSSHPVARRFTENTYRMSAVTGISPPAHAAGLAPRLTGEINGFRPDFDSSFGGGHSYQVFQRNLHLLLGPQGSLDAFVDRLEADAPAALRADLDRHLDRMQRNLRQLDTRLGLLLTRPGADPAGWTRLAETQHDLQGECLRLRALLPTQP